MKILINENKLRDIQFKFLNRLLVPSNVYSGHTRMLIYNPDLGENDWEYDSPIMEYVYGGGLYVDKPYITEFVKIYFPNWNDAYFVLKEWFEKSFGVKVKTIEFM